MVSSISSSMNSAAMMSSSSMSRPPEGKNAFTVSDTDGSGSVSGSELDALASGLSEATGTTITTNDLSEFDTDSDSGLSGEEMFDMLSSMGFSPQAVEGGEKGSGPPPPPPPSSEEAISAYSQNSGSDMMSQLLDALGDSGDDEETSILSSISA